MSEQTEAEATKTVRTLWQEMLDLISSATKDEAKATEKGNLAAARRLRKNVLALRKVATSLLKQSRLDSANAPPKRVKKKSE